MIKLSRDYNTDYQCFICNYKTVTLNTVWIVWQLDFIEEQTIAKQNLCTNNIKWLEPVHQHSADSLQQKIKVLDKISEKLELPSFVNHDQTALIKGSCIYW